MLFLFKLYFIFFIFTAIHGASYAEEEQLTSQEDEQIEYAKFDHSIQIDSLRSGNHDEDGTNEYEFNVKMMLYKRPPKVIDPRKKKVKQEIKIFKDIELGKIPKIEIDVLTWWKPKSHEKKEFKLKFNGDFLRKSIAKFMNEQNIKESEIRAKVDIELFEKGLIPYFHKDKLLSNYSYEVYDIVDKLNDDESIDFKIKPDNGGGMFTLKILPKPKKKKKK